MLKANTRYIESIAGVEEINRIPSRAFKRGRQTIYTGEGVYEARLKRGGRSASSASNENCQGLINLR